LNSNIIYAHSEEELLVPNLYDLLIKNGIPQPAVTSFILNVLYKNDQEKNKELLSQYGTLFSSLMGHWQQKNNYFLKPQLFKKPIRLGIVSNHIREHSVWSALTRGWVEHLNRDDFQLFFFYTGTAVDKETEFAKSIATDFIQCGKDLDRGVNAILKGNGLGGAQLLFLPQNAVFENNDQIYTSGSDGIIKEGLYVGKIITDNKKDIKKRKYSVDLGFKEHQLNYVSVLKVKK
jgi:hypothetical protein